MSNWKRDTDRYIRENPVELVNAQTIGSRCGRFPTQQAAEDYLRGQGYTDSDFWRHGSGQVWFLGGVNC